jgi:predicted small secreted protein
MTRNPLLHAILAIAFLVGLGASVSGCNTVEGIGKDISAAGRAMGASGDSRR